MNKVYKNICKFLACEHLTSEEGKITLSEEQVENIESSLQANHDMIAELSLKMKTAEDENKKLSESNKDLEAKLASLPAASTTNIVDEKKTEHEPTAFDDFVQTGISARALYDSLS